MATEAANLCWDPYYLGDEQSDEESDEETESSLVEEGGRSAA